MCRAANYVGGCQAGFAQRLNRGCRVALAEFGAVGIHDQRMMIERERLPALQQARQQDLSSGRWQQVVSPDDPVDTVAKIVNHDGELISPLAEPVTDDRVAALC